MPATKLQIDLRSIASLLLLALPLKLFCQQTKEDFKSSKTGDTYEIIIRKPQNFDPTKAYHVVYFTDAGINSGKTILSQPEDDIRNCILIGIAHKGDWDTKRQRDFIPSDVSGSNDYIFGQASKFYLFMKEELIPYIDKKYNKTKSKVFVGHSFGGLLALYMSMRQNRLFDHYYAISPSVWANYKELMKIEKEYATKNKSYNSNISIYAGSLEFLNRVLSSSQEFFTTVKGRNYTGLSISRSVISGVNHYGIVPKVVPEIFKRLK
jgi:predicted alpha/beta superfamily hydrolase